MTCSFDKDLVHEFAVGEVTHAERERVAAHLEECSDCRGEVALDRQLAHDLADLPEYPVPEALEEVLVLASIQSWRTQGARRPAGMIRVRTKPAWPYILGGLAGAGLLTMIVLLLWPGRIASWSPVNTVVGGSVGQGLGFMDGVLRWGSDLQAAWQIVQHLAARFSPVAKALRTVLGSISGSFWFGLVIGLVGSALSLWRIARPGRKRSVGHA